MSELRRAPRTAVSSGAIRRADRTARPAPAAGAGGAKDALRRLQNSRKDHQGIEPADRDRSLPLAAAQQRLWFLDQLNPGSAAYNAPLALRLTGPLDTAVLERALGAVVARHEILRTRYGSADGLPFQIVDAPGPVPLPVTDLRELPAAEREPRAAELIAEEAARPFDLGTGPVFRAALFRLAADEHILLLNMHHIATDGWSTAIISQEVTARYAAEAAGAGDPLPPLPVQFADYAVWQRRMLAAPGFEKRLAYWTERLADLPVLDLPTDRPRPKEPTGSGSVLETRLPAALQQSMVELARTERVTALTVALAAFQVLLARYTGQQDIVVGSVVNGRTRKEIEPLVGFFANTLVLRTDTSGSPTFRELLTRTNEAVVGGLLHQDVPFDKLVERLRPDRESGRNPLFQMSFTLQSAAAEEQDWGELRIEQVPLVVGTSRFDLAMQLTEVPGEGYQLWVEYSTELFDAERIERLMTHYRQLLTAMVADPEVRVDRVELLGTAEREALTRGENRTDVVYDTGEHCLHQLFERQVDDRPDQPAVRFRGRRLTYAELDRRANRLAHALRARGVGPESRVGVMLERGLELPVTQLAILKAGAAYVPLDPVHPANRIAYVLDRAGCELVVTEGPLAETLPESAELLDWRDPDLLDELETRSDERPVLAVRPRNLAYVIFTSGSTGSPKGVLVEHRSAVNFTNSAVEMFRLGPDDRMLQFANPAFDVSVFEIFGALSSGATLVLAPRDTLLDPPSLAALIREEGVTTADIPPSLLAVLDPAEVPGLHKLFVGLEPFPGDLVDRWRDGGKRDFHNGYGPTETTVASVDHLCGPQRTSASPPIGRPLANQYAYLLDPYGAPVPRGVVGELWIGGLGLSRGYAGSPGATAERFAPDPFAAPGGRMYRTGDLALRRNDGDLEFFGRADSQVKIRGLRIEPSEIEQLLARQPEIRQAAVIVDTTDPGGPRLVAHVVPASGDVPSGAVLRDRLAADLPPYMLPNAFVTLDGLPLNTSGKLDRTRLPDPAQTQSQSAERRDAAPATGTERTVAGIWAGLLTSDSFARDDNFFLVGGNSMQATQLLARIREAFGVEVPLHKLFTHATIEQLAALIDTAREEAEPTRATEPTRTTAGTGETAARTHAPVVLAAGDAGRPVLHLLHPSGGSVAPYVPLAGALRADQPCHALPAPDLSGELTDPVGALAEAHAAAVRAAQPEGPYLLGGWSTGGALAFETARRLRATGAEVALVALLDTDVPPGLAEPPSTAQALALYASDVAGLGGSDRAPDTDGIAALDEEEQFTVVAQRIIDAGLAPDSGTEQLLAGMRTFVTTVRAGAVWRPEPVDVPLALITADTDGADDRARYWTGRTSADCRHLRAPGDHYGMVAAPHVGTVAELLQDIIDGAATGSVRERAGSR
ncbi:amino acid adenylation domain-containing protein [Streptomyces triticagri]|uniref:Amino acid adenylation domain-containing protein n=1 Tax=Streptomyces triticagri TaxID=2293568 RepID=A0A372LYS6_9ACTN|nr:non-ribosomal peptide synthetase [Streptomyces triticagri]RFU83415.1 amino acid adenylation domain-containing protein [Streptomyces triticagri]